MTTASHLIALGTKTRWGKVAAIGWIGERYYWLISKDGVVSLMPATVIDMECRKPWK